MLFSLGDARLGAMLFARLYSQLTWATLSCPTTRVFCIQFLFASVDDLGKHCSLYGYFPPALCFVSRFVWLAFVSVRETWEVKSSALALFRLSLHVISSRALSSSFVNDSTSLSSLASCPFRFIDLLSLHVFFSLSTDPRRVGGASLMLIVQPSPFLRSRRLASTL